MHRPVCARVGVQTRSLADGLKEPLCKILVSDILAKNHVYDSLTSSRGENGGH